MVSPASALTELRPLLAAAFHAWVATPPEKRTKEARAVLLAAYWPHLEHLAHERENFKRMHGEWADSGDYIAVVWQAFDGCLDRVAANTTRAQFWAWARTRCRGAMSDQDRKTHMEASLSSRLTIKKAQAAGEPRRAIRSLNAYRTHRDGDELADAVAGRSPDEWDRRRREAREELDDLMATTHLSPKQTECLHLMADRGLTQEEAARAAGVTATISSLAIRALRQRSAHAAD